MSIADALQQVLPTWLRKFRMGDIKPEDIRADEIGLEREEKRLEAALDEAQSKIDEITGDTVASGRKSGVPRATRKIMQINDRVRVHEAELAQVSRQLIALGRLRRLVEGTELAASGVLDSLKHLPQAQLERVLSGALARDELARDGLAQVADMVNVPPRAETAEPEDARQLREALEAAIDAKDPALAQTAIESAGATSLQHESL